jgi:hypothetical protein
MYACIDEATEERAVLGLYLEVHPYFDPYRDDPRFTSLLRRMRLEEKVRELALPLPASAVPRSSARVL